MKNLIDTNIIIDSLRGEPKSKDYLRNETFPACSIITAAELIQGLKNKLEQKRLKIMLEDFNIINTSESIGQKMIELMYNYSLSNGLRIPDALIAAAAIEENLILVTSNTKHFSFIPGLKLIGWNKI